MSRRRSSSEDPTLCGAVNLDKPPGVTSHDMVQAMRRLYGTRRVGHTGTLDPGATGVLPILLGGATRFSQYLQHLGKTYQVVARLGLTTDTQDLEGQELSSSEVRPEPEAVPKALEAFLGESLQVPPMYSAKKVDGRPLYELARAGQTVERQPVRIAVDRIDDVRYVYPSLSFRIAVSSGTYIRTICHDLGQQLGCGAVMAELRRLVAGPFKLEAAVTLEDLSRSSLQERLGKMVSLEEVFTFLPAVRVRSGRESRVGHGLPLGAQDCESFAGLPEQDEKVCILSASGKMLAIGESRRNGGVAVVAPVRVLAASQADASEERRGSTVRAASDG